MTSTAAETTNVCDGSLADADLSIFSDVPSPNVPDDTDATTNVRHVSFAIDPTFAPSIPNTPDASILHGVPETPDAPKGPAKMLDPADLDIPASMRTPTALSELRKMHELLSTLAVRLDESDQRLMKLDRHVESMATALDRNFQVLFTDNFETRALLHDTLDTVINSYEEGEFEVVDSISDLSHEDIAPGTDLASEVGRAGLDRERVTFATPPRNTTRVASASRGAVANAPQTPGKTPRTAWRRHGTAANLQRVVSERNADRLEAIAKIDPTFAGHNPNA